MRGPVHLTMNRSFAINTMAEEAQRQVHLWLLDEVSCNIGADKPDLASRRGYGYVIINHNQHNLRYRF